MKYYPTLLPQGVYTNQLCNTDTSPLCESFGYRASLELGLQLAQYTERAETLLTMLEFAAMGALECAEKYAHTDFTIKSLRMIEEFKQVNQDLLCIDVEQAAFELDRAFERNKDRWAE